MHEFLSATRYCDATASTIRRASVTLSDGGCDEIELAVRAFRFVRDSVRYTFSPWGCTAADTLRRQVGVCTNKSNLLIALWRAAGIPGAYGILSVNPQEYFGSIAPAFLKPLVSNRSVHVYAAAFLAGRWVRCDPSTDIELAEKTAHFCRQTRLVEWDGRQDALDFLQPQHVYADFGLRACIDDLLEKPPRHAQPATLAAINRYLRFIREEPVFPTADDLIAAYGHALDRETRLRA